MENKLANHSVLVEKQFAADVARVYAAWTDPKLFAQWMGPGNVKVKDISIDLKVGGKYRLTMVTDQGDQIVGGEYLEIVPNEKLVFTWVWEREGADQTQVTVDFKGVGGGTLLKLNHEHNSSPEAAEHHKQGWNGCFENLEKFL